MIVAEGAMRAAKEATEKELRVHRIACCALMLKVHELRQELALVAAERDLLRVLARPKSGLTEIIKAHLCQLWRQK